MSETFYYQFLNGKGILYHESGGKSFKPVYRGEKLEKDSIYSFCSKVFKDIASNGFGSREFGFKVKELRTGELMLSGYFDLDRFVDSKEFEKYLDLKTI